MLLTRGWTVYESLDPRPYARCYPLASATERPPECDEEVRPTTPRLVQGGVWEGCMSKRVIAVQPILGVIAPDRKALTPSQQELVRRAGTHLSLQQRMTSRRRARAVEAEHEQVKSSTAIAADVAALLPKLGRLR